MAPNSWRDIEELFLQGLYASETIRKELLREAVDPDIAAAVARLWADAAAMPSSFLPEETASASEGGHHPGDLIEGRFRLESLLGKGGMGTVFGARDERLGRAVALKFLNPRLAKHPVLGGSLEREARAICGLENHPGICTVYDLYWNAEPPFLVMEFLPGETLAEHLSRGPLPVTEAVAIGLSIIDGLVHAHQKGVIHRDVKPANVMLTPLGPKLFDFGIARRASNSLIGGTNTLAPPGSFLGSASYSSPEQVEGRTVDARSDIFSVGCVLYEMITGTKAFDGPSWIATVSAVLRAHPRRMDELNPALPAEYARIATKCLEKDPDARFQKAVDVRNALDNLARRGFATPGSRIESSRSWAHHQQANHLRVAPSIDQSLLEERISSTDTPQSPVATTSLQRRGLLASGSLHPIPAMLSVVWGLMVGLALLVEVAYEWPAFSAWAQPVAAVTSLSSIVVAMAAFALLRRRTADGRPGAVLVTLAILMGWSVVLALAIAPQLPDRPIVRAAIQTMTANVGYPKSLLEALALPVLALVPLQVVCALEAELQRGGAQRVHRILSLSEPAGAIDGVLIVRPGAASIVFGTVTIWWIGANTRLIESLQNGPYFSLFLQLAVVRVAIGLTMLFAVLVWYVWTMNRLRQRAHEETASSATSGAV